MKDIYLHGFASGATSGKAQYFARRFAETGRHLEIPQLDGGDFENLTITGQLRVIERTAAGQPVNLIGSSMGGYLAALYASMYPEVGRLILLAPAFYFPQRWPDSLGPEKTVAWKNSGSMEVFHYGENRNRAIRYTLIEDCAQYPPAPAFEQPALIFHGNRDDVVPAAYSEEFAAIHSNVRVRILESDHQLTDQVELIWEESRAFLFGPDPSR